MAESGTYTAAAFAAKMDAFIFFCENEGIDATDYQLMKYFGMTPAVLEKHRTLDRLNGDSKMEPDGYAVSLKKLDLYREDATIRQVVNDPKLASHCAFKLRQPHWGSWSDKTDIAKDLNICVKLGDGDKELME